jgi:hypothetical protein
VADVVRYHHCRYDKTNKLNKILTTSSTSSWMFSINIQASVFSAAFDLEAEYAGARRRNGGNCTSLFVVVFMRVRVPLIPSLPPAAAN